MENKFKLIGGLLLIFVGALIVWEPFTAIISLFIGGFIFIIIGTFIIISSGIYLFFYWVIPGIPEVVSKLCVNATYPVLLGVNVHLIIQTDSLY